MKYAILLLAVLITSLPCHSQTNSNKTGKLKVVTGNAMHYTRVAAVSGSGVDSIGIPVFSKGSIFEIGANNVICDSAILDIHSDTFTAFKVIITSPSGQNITADQFAYSDKTQTGILRGQVTSLKNGKKTSGQYAELDFSADNYQIVKIK